MLTSPTVICVQALPAASAERQTRNLFNLPDEVIDAEAIVQIRALDGFCTLRFHQDDIVDLWFSDDNIISAVCPKRFLLKALILIIRSLKFWESNDVKKLDFTAETEEKILVFFI